ncbi:MAG TPA: GNAT family N-acetyltransferase [Bacteroidia bacterium]
MITLKRTTSDNNDFQALVTQLDEVLRILDGEDHAFFAALNTSDTIKHVILAYDNNEPAGCGAIRQYSNELMEVKRMYVLPEKRGKGIASTVLKELESWSKELGFNTLILETGNKQTEAIALYKKTGYHIIPNYGKYEHVESSICFEKRI